MTDYVFFAIDEQISFTGVSANIPSSGALNPVAAINAEHDHPGGTLRVVLSGFNFSYPSGFSTMGLDLAVFVGGIGESEPVRFIPATRFEPTARQFTWLSPAPLPAGRYPIGFSARAVLFNGPPIAITLTGTVTLSATADIRALAFSPPQPQNVDAGATFDVVVNLGASAAEAVGLKLTSQNARVTLQPAEATIPQGASTTVVKVTGMTGGSDFVTVEADGFAAATLAVVVRPVLSDLAPPSGPGGTVIVLTGQGFAPRATVIMDNRTPRAAFVDPTRLSVTVPQFPGGPVNVSVEVNNAVSGQLTFLATLPLPVIRGFNPNAGPPLTVVEIDGDQFGGTSRVDFNGTVAQLNQVSEQRVVAAVPHFATSGPITVETAGGRVSSAESFTILPPPPPTITRFTPARGWIGTRITVEGSNLLWVTQAVLRGSRSRISPNDVAASVEVISDTSCTVTVPPVSGPGFEKSVSGVGMFLNLVSETVGALSADTFTIAPPEPVVNGFAPRSGPVGTVLTVNGTGLSAMRRARFLAVEATVRVRSDNEITVVVPNGAESAAVFLLGDVNGFLVTATFGPFEVTRPPDLRDVTFNAAAYTVNVSGDTIGFPAVRQPFSVIFPFVYFGNVASGAFTARIEAPGERLDIPVPSMAPGTSQLLYKRYPDGLAAGRYEFQAFLDVFNQLTEVNKTNNQSLIVVRVG